MNSSSYEFNVSSTQSYRDSFSTAVAKNVIVVALGLIINYINSTLIHTFRKHQIFQVTPRYILFIHLVVNDMIQLTTTINLFVFSYAFYTFNASFCCLLVTFAVFTTINTPLNLAVMAVECYIAVCLPLRHAELCTIKRTYILIGCIWALSALSVLTDVFIVLVTEPVELFYSTIFCEMNNIFRHPISIKKREVFYMIYVIVVWLILFYTYLKVFLAAKAAKAADGYAKARNTILLHGFQLLLSILTYTRPLLMKAVVYQCPKHNIQIRFGIYIIINILPRFMSPIVYGLRDKTFRQYLLKTVRKDNKS